MIRYMKMLVATAWVAIAVAALWVGAFLNWSMRRSEAAIPDAVRRTPDAVRVTPYAVVNADVASKPYVASIRQDSKTYHLRTCSKFGSTLKAVKEYESEDEARADGKKPCTYCLGVAHR